MLHTVKCTKLANEVVLRNMTHGELAVIFYCCVHNESCLISTPCQVNPLHAYPSYFFLKHISICSPFLKFPPPTKSLYAFLISSPYVLRERTILPTAFYHQKLLNLYKRNHGLTFNLNHLTWWHLRFHCLSQTSVQEAMPGHGWHSECFVSIFGCCWDRNWETITPNCFILQPNHMSFFYGTAIILTLPPQHFFYSLQ